MEPLLIALGVIAVAVSLLIALLKSNRCDSLQNEEVMDSLFTIQKSNIGEA